MKRVSKGRWLCGLAAGLVGLAPRPRPQPAARRTAAAAAPHGDAPDPAEATTGTLTCNTVAQGSSFLAAVSEGQTCLLGPGAAAGGDDSTTASLSETFSHCAWDSNSTGCLLLQEEAATWPPLEMPAFTIAVVGEPASPDKEAFTIADGTAEQREGGG